jgi:hypothetical protein
MQRQTIMFTNKDWSLFVSDDFADMIGRDTLGGLVAIAGNGRPGQANPTIQNLSPATSLINTTPPSAGPQFHLRPTIQRHLSASITVSHVIATRQPFCDCYLSLQPPR